MKKIKIKFVDFNVGLGFTKEKNDFVETLSKKYEVIQCDDPDYIFYSVFGADHLKHDCVRIFYTGECYTPDFNECDYAIGYDRMRFGDRYLRVPLYRLLRYKNSYDEIVRPRNFTIEDITAKTGFCNFVYSNCFAQGARARFFDMLSQYKRIESGGCYRNNVGGPVPNKRKFQESTKFTIAFENTTYDGYATEKLVEAFAAGTVPIYYGDPNISTDFNPEAFINVHDYNNFDEVIARVIEIDEDDELYLKMLNTPPVLNPSDNSDMAEFLYHIFDQPLEAAQRRSKSLTVKAMDAFKLRHQLSEKLLYKYISKVQNTIVRLKTGTKLHGKPKTL